jgi:tetratricopeptide (TPR) repeat protein
MDGMPTPLDQATAALQGGDVSRAIAILRQACAAAPPSGADPQVVKAHLTHLMNLGELLTYSGQLDQADAVLRSSLEARRRFYPAEHPGIAYGLEPLAALLHTRGDDGQAAPFIDEAARILWAAGHEHLVPVLALRAYIYDSASGEETAPRAFTGLERMPEELFDALVGRCLQRLGNEEPARVVRVMNRLRQAIHARRGPAEPVLSEVESAIANAAREAGDHATRALALSWLLARAEATGDTRQATTVVLGMALAHDEAGSAEASDRAYQEATARAVQLGDPAVLAQVQRNRGLFLAQRERREQAAPILAGAVDHARTAARSQLPDGPDELGRALIAHGIFVQHGGELEQARRLLEEALALLPPSHADTLYARSHLTAIVEQRSCGCGDMSGAISQALEAMVKDQLPEGLLAHISLRIDENGKPDVRVELARQPDERELERLQQVVHRAVTTLQENIRARR